MRDSEKESEVCIRPVIIKNKTIMDLSVMYEGQVFIKDMVFSLFLTACCTYTLESLVIVSLTSKFRRFGARKFGKKYIQIKLNTYSCPSL